ncbi:UNVERIFIED_CONTAM: hypothetical protein FKN15_074361 [Acipenser sinensis]
MMHKYLIVLACLVCYTHADHSNLVLEIIENLNKIITAKLGVKNNEQAGDLVPSRYTCACEAEVLKNLQQHLEKETKTAVPELPALIAKVSELQKYSSKTESSSGCIKKLENSKPGRLFMKYRQYFRRWNEQGLILAVSRAYEQSLPKFLDFIVKETYNWFSQSAGRQITYKKLFAAINDGEEPQKILRACATRWISVEPAVRRILQQWLELKALFAVARENERCYMADQLYRLYCDPQSRAFLIFVKNVLSQVQAVNKTFQGNNVDPTKLIDGLIRLVTSLGCSVTLPTAQVDYLKGDIRQHLDPRPQLGYEAEKAIREDAVPEAAKAGIRWRCVDFTVKLLEEFAADVCIICR